MEQRLVKLSDMQLASMIKYREGADPIHEEIQFMILLALKELEAYRACFPLERAQEWALIEKEKRLVVLPCKVGDPIFTIHERGKGKEAEMCVLESLVDHFSGRRMATRWASFLTGQRARPPHPSARKKSIIPARCHLHRRPSHENKSKMVEEMPVLREQGR